MSRRRPHPGRSTDPKDVKQVHALQDAIKVEQPSARAASRCRTGTRPARRRCARRCWCSPRRCPIPKRMFGPREQVDPVRHLIGTALAWGGNPEKERSISTSRRAQNDGTTVYRLKVKDVPVDGFWSISVYNAEGYFQKNAYDAYSLNNITAKKGADGSVADPVRRLRRQDRELPADHARAGTTWCGSIVRAQKS